MGYQCFLCGEKVIEEDNLLTLTEEFGDIINAIHKECYDNDDRDFLNRTEIRRYCSCGNEKLPNLEVCKECK